MWMDGWQVRPFTTKPSSSWRRKPMLFMKLHLFCSVITFLCSWKCVDCTCLCMFRDIVRQKTRRSRRGSDDLDRSTGLVLVVPCRYLNLQQAQNCQTKKRKKLKNTFLTCMFGVLVVSMLLIMHHVSDRCPRCLSSESAVCFYLHTSTSR